MQRPKERLCWRRLAFRQGLLGEGQLPERVGLGAVEALLEPGRGLLGIAEAARKLAELEGIFRRERLVEPAAFEGRLIGLERLLLEFALREQQRARLRDRVVHDR